MVLTKNFLTVGLIVVVYLISIVSAQDLSSSVMSVDSTETASSIKPTNIDTNTVEATSTLITSHSSLSSVLHSVTSSSATITPLPNNANTAPTVQPTGWDSNGNMPPNSQQSWLREHNRFIFVIFIGLLVLGILIWYVVRSVKGMRIRLERENQAQLYMMQQATGNHPPPPRSDRIIPESTLAPPPAYKAEEGDPANSTQNTFNNSNQRY